MRKNRLLLLVYASLTRYMLPLFMASAPLVHAQTTPPQPQQTLPAQPTNQSTQPSWSSASKWLYAALAARFEDNAGDYQAAMRSISPVADESGQYEAFSYSYYLALDTLQLEKAQNLAEQWLAHYPKDSEAQQALLIALIRNNKIDDAFALMQLMLNTDSGPQTVAQIVKLLTYSNDGKTRLNLLQKLSQVYPNNPFIWYYRGLIAKELGQIDEAIASFNEALTLDQHWQQLKLMQAEALSEIGDLKQARQLMRDLYQQAPSDPIILSTYIDLNVDHYQWEEALELANKWRQSAPEDNRIRHLIAWLKLNAKHYPQALEDYQQLLNENLIDHNEYLFQTAKAAEIVEQYDQATQRLKQITQDSALYLFAQQNQALIAFKQHNIQSAMDTLAKLRKDFKDYRLETYLLELHHLNQLKEKQLARQQLDQALSEFPDQVDLLYALAQWQIQHTSATQAEQTYQKILDLDPANIDTLNAYGYLLLTHTNQIERANTMLTQAIQSYPDSPAIQDSYGWLLYQQGHPQEALEWVRRAYTAYRQNDITPHYIELLIQTDNKPLAQQIYQYERIGQPDNQALQQIGQTYQLENTP